MAFGLLATGFVPKTLEDIRSEINDSLRSAFGQSIDLSDDSVLGQITGILSERYALLWELAEAINVSQDPDAAVDAALDALSALTGTIRRPAAESIVTLTLTGTPATLVPTGSQASTASTALVFETIADATIAASAAWAPTTAYLVGDRVTNSGNVYVCSTAGTSAGSGGPVGTGVGEVDGTAAWDFLGAGTGDIDAVAESADTGPIVGTSRDITVITTPVAGWNGAINLLDATVGRNIETNEALRVRRELELASAGTGTVDAVRAALLGVTDVTAATVFHNTTDVTDVDGIPPHAVEALVQGGADQDIWDQLLAAVAAGIATHGTETGTSTDSVGNDHTMKFTRPTEIPIWIEIDVLVDADQYPIDGDAQIESAITGGAFVGITGRDAVSSAIKAECFEVSGVLDVTAARIGLAVSPTLEATLPIELRELATYDSSRIVVVSTPSTP